MNNSKKRFLKLAIFTPILLILGYLANTYYKFEVWNYQGHEIEFTIRPGEPFSRINHRLKKQEIINDSTLFYRMARVKKLVDKFRVGTYTVSPGMNMDDLFVLFTTGAGKGIKVTFPEGKNLYEMAKILEEKKIIKSKSNFIEVAKSSEVASSLNIESPTVEGYLYPDTYEFPAEIQPKTVIKKMVRNFFAKTKKLDFTRSKLSPHEVIILSSIVEKETGAGFERPIIAGVFLNRLNKKMRLQSDPTTIYGIYENFNGNLRKKHLRQKTPYNTYRINGLPKGPISNPGLESIKAVLMPKKHQYLYFVSQNDGTHIFTKTYKEHLAAVNKWQKTRRNRQGKSWRQLRQ